MAVIYKIEEGKRFTKNDYFYVGDPQKSTTWKLKKGGSPGVVDRVHVGAAAAALGPNPPHGQGVEIPREAIAGVKSRIKSAMRGLDYTEEEMRENFAWLFGENEGSDPIASLPVSDPGGELIDMGSDPAGKRTGDDGGERIEMEVFKTGDYGRKGKYTEKDLDQIITDYNTDLHEAPVTLDHAKTGPAHGWVKELKRSGDRLIAQIGDLSPWFRDALKSKSYKNRSIEIVPKFKQTGRNYFRALSFLGAQSPEVKGLRNFKFSEDQEIYYFDEGGEDEMEIAELKTKIENLVKKNAELEKEFAEKNEGLKKELVINRIDGWLKEKTASGHVTPAMLKAGLREALIFADLRSDQVLEFSEEKKSLGDVIREILSQHKILEFQEEINTEDLKSEKSEKVNKAKELGITVQEYEQIEEKIKDFEGISVEDYLKFSEEKKEAK